MIGPRIATCQQVGTVRSSFAPTDITGLKLWLKADTGLYQERTGASATTPASADADPVGSWLDQSGQANHITAASDARRPALKLAIQNGLPVVRFDGVDDYLNRATTPSLAPDRTVFLVAKTPNAAGFLCSSQFGTELDAFYHSSATTGRWEVTPQLLWTASNAWRVLTLSTTATTAAVRRNGAAHASAGGKSPSTAAGFLIGGSTYLNYGATDYAEVLAYTPGLTSDQIAQVESYLNTRWGVY